MVEHHEITDYDPSLYNHDLAPVPADKRTWNKWHIASLWIGMAVCITTYTLAGSLINAGMNWWQALLTITLGNLIVLIPMCLNAHAGTKYGVPFPVLLRASFGTRGANLPALMRAFVACGWFGIQTWIGGWAIYVLVVKMCGQPMIDPAKPENAHLLIPFIGLTWGQLVSFMAFWVINLYFIIAGTESIKWMEALAAPFLLIVGAALLWWGVSKGGGFANVLSDATIAKIRSGKVTDFNFWKAFWPNLTAMVAYWATMSLNIPDFTRYCPTQKDQVVGQLMGLPTTMVFYSFIGIAVTAASVIIFNGEVIWDPVTLMGKFDSVLIVILGLFGLLVATLSTNIAANVVSPANDISNLAPHKISFRMGGIITAVIGILIFPWKLYYDPNQYTFTWLIGYSALLGSVAGVMLADYFIVRKSKLNVKALYRSNSEYAFGGSGWNWRAVVAAGLAIVPNIPGFILTVAGIKETTILAAELADPKKHVWLMQKLIPLVTKFGTPGFWLELYTHAWFNSVAIAGVLYILFSKIAPVPVPASDYPSGATAPASVD